MVAPTSRSHNFVAMIIALLVIVVTHHHDPVLIWNASSSVPMGLYRVVHRPVTRGQLAVLELPSAVATFARARGYLPTGVYLLKPIVAIAGDRVCRVIDVVTLNGRVVAVAHLKDGAGRTLPRWQGCRGLAHNEIFVLAGRPGSFDGRYFGPLTVDMIVGRAEALWTIKHR